MWEAIRDNNRRSRLLIGLMGTILAGLGALIGAVYGGSETALAGALVALGIWLVLLLVTFTSGEQVLMATARAREIKKEDSPRLFNVVEEMTIASGLGKPPRIFIVDSDVPNAFAAGRKPETACVAVTSGLLKRLNRDELQGVIAHEIAHIKNLDVRFMTIAGVMVGSVAIISDVFLRSMIWGGGGRRRGGGKGGQAQAILMLVAIVVAILAPIATQLLYYACSRRREYLADASAARFTRYPPGLASALGKIAGGMRAKQKQEVSRVLAPMYIVNPLQAASAGGGWFSTHPPTQKRIDVLRSMSGAGWVDYEKAFKQVSGAGASCIGARTLASEGSVAARAASAEPDTKKEVVQRAREVGDLLDRMVDFLLIPCVCGVRIKVPPDSGRTSVPCPRCGRQHEVPQAKAGREQTGTKADGGEVLRYKRRGDGWESFRCACGRPMQISPALQVKSMRCRACKRKIEIVA